MLNIQRRAGVAIVAMPVDVDAANADSVAEDLVASVTNEGAGIVVDLRPTRYLDSAGIDMLFRLHDRLLTRRQRMHVVVDEDAPLMRVLRIVAAADVLPLHHDLDAAVQAAAGAEGRPAPA